MKYGNIYCNLLIQKAPFVQICEANVKQRGVLATSNQACDSKFTNKEFLRDTQRNSCLITAIYQFIYLSFLNCFCNSLCLVVCLSQLQLAGSPFRNSYVAILTGHFQSAATEMTNVKFEYLSVWRFTNGLYVSSMFKIIIFGREFLTVYQHLQN